MIARNILLASLLAVLCGCQPEVSDKYTERLEWQVAEKVGCLMCHTTGKNLLGPAWEKVSDRYRDNPDAEAHLMNQILNGTRGAWVERDMPAYSEQLLSTADRKKLVKFIMSLG